MNPPLQVGRELPDVEAIRSRLNHLDEEAALLRKLLRLTIRIEGRKPLVTHQSNTKPEAADAAAR